MPLQRVGVELVDTLALRSARDAFVSRRSQQSPQVLPEPSEKRRLRAFATVSQQGFDDVRLYIPANRTLEPIRVADQEPSRPWKPPAQNRRNAEPFLNHGQVVKENDRRRRKLTTSGSVVVTDRLVGVQSAVMWREASTDPFPRIPKQPCRTVDRVQLGEVPKMGHVVISLTTARAHAVGRIRPARLPAASASGVASRRDSRICGT